eukprot:594021-Amphidinium_carterae.2
MAVQQCDRGLCGLYTQLVHYMGSLHASPLGAEPDSGRAHHCGSPAPNGVGSCLLHDYHMPERKNAQSCLIGVLEVNLSSASLSMPLLPRAIEGIPQDMLRVAFAGNRRRC